MAYGLGAHCNPPTETKLQKEKRKVLRMLADDEILEFIYRRFPEDCNAHWLNGNCYYFAAILKLRFPEVSIIYDAIDGHFLIKYGNSYYDWTGLRYCFLESPSSFYEWEQLQIEDPLYASRIIRDCIM